MKHLVLLIASFLSVSIAVQPMNNHAAQAPDVQDQSIASQDMFQLCSGDVITLFILHTMGVMEIDPLQPWTNTKKLYQLKTVNKKTLTNFPTAQDIAKVMGIPLMHLYATIGDWAKIVQLKIDHNNLAERCVFFHCPFGFTPFEYAQGVHHDDVMTDILTPMPALGLGKLCQDDLITAEQFKDFLVQITAEQNLHNVGKDTIFPIFKKHVANIGLLKGNINSTHEGYTLLMDAANYWNPERLQELLKHKNINVNTNNAPRQLLRAYPLFAQTALHCAAVNNAECLTELLKRDDIDINAGNYEGQTALHIAAYYGKLECIQELLAHGAHILEDKYGDTAFNSAIQGNRLECFRELLKHSNVNYQYNDGSKLIHWVIFYGPEFLDELLTHEKLQCDELNANGETALHLAADKGLTNAVEKLLAFGANADITNQEGYTALDLAQARLKAYENSEEFGKIICGALYRTIVKMPEPIEEQGIAQGLPLVDEQEEDDVVLCMIQ